MDKNKPTELVYKAERGEYKGHAMIKLTSGANERYPFQFGLQKAKRILACLKDIEAFVAEQEALPKAEPETKVAVK